MKFNIQQKDYLIENNVEIKNLDSYESSFFYGEVNHYDIFSIIYDKIISQDINSDNFNFIDIGSGCGKLVIYIYNKSSFHCTGIEIIEHRYLHSIKNLGDNVSNLEFIHDDFKNIYFGNYDIIYCCNIIFSEKHNDMLYFKLNNEFQGYALLFTYNNKISSKLISTHQVNTSWQKNVLIYLFYF